MAAYGFTLDVAQAGQKADLANDTVDSYAAEGVVAFGAGVVQGTADTQCKRATANTQDFLGVAVFTHTVENDGTATGYADEDAVSVMTEGRIYVTASGSVNKEQLAYVNVASGAGQGVTFKEDSTNGLGPVGKFKTSGSNGELVVVEIIPGADRFTTA